MQFYRGAEIRKIPSHVKIEVIAGVFAKRRFILAAAPGPSYASEVKLVEPLLSNILSHIPVLADKAYDCIRLIEYLIANNSTPAIAIKEGRLATIRNPLRIQSKQNADIHEIYKDRPLIEGLFGNIKQKLSSHVRLFNLHITQLFALLRLALFNIAVLISVDRVFMCLWFSNSLTASSGCHGSRQDIPPPAPPVPWR
jgi:hypothetical protein